MNITKIIEEELGQELEKAGFQPAFKESGVWPYERKKNGVRQMVTIITGRYSKKALKVLFDTDAYGQRTGEFQDFVPEEDVKHQEFWRYKSEEQLRIVLKEFERLLFTYGLNFLETISKPTTDAVPTEEMEQYLYQNHWKLYEEYSLKLQTQGKSAEEVIEIINQTMQQNINETFENVKDLLIGLAALYGHAISWGDRGKWNWDEKSKRCWLENILDTNRRIPLLTWIFPEWDARRKYRLRYGGELLRTYEIILRVYYEEHPEEKKLNNADKGAD